MYVFYMHVIIIYTLYIQNLHNLYTDIHIYTHIYMFTHTEYTYAHTRTHVHTHARTHTLLCVHLLHLNLLVFDIYI